MTGNISGEDIYMAKQALLKSVEWIDEDIRRLKMQLKDSPKINIKKWNAAIQEMMWTRKGVMVAYQLMEDADGDDKRS